MSTSRHHAEWLSLVETSGPFLSLPELLRVFPQGLDAHEPEHFRTLRAAFEEWQQEQEKPHPRASIHTAWIEFVLTETLELPEEVVAKGQDIPQTLKATISEHGETLRPDIVVRNPQDLPGAGKPRLLIQTYPLNQSLDRPLPDRHWKASPATRMMELLHSTDVPLGLVTNGEHWMLVCAPRGETTGFASWYASLWLEEPITLRAFRSLLGVSRFFGVPDRDTLEAMLKESATHQQEVTDQLGYQVRQAVEVLVQAIDRIDQDRNRELLREYDEKRLYEAALTVMMRLVFLFCAEERGLLLLGDPIYDQFYAVSTLREQLREAADQHGEEVLERHKDAWCRLLSAFRAVHGGVHHDRMSLQAYGGSLFDPDRFPFLEGRPPNTSWRDTRAMPLPIDNRTVLHLLESLQLLQLRIPGGGMAEAQRLSFRALDIEQIGHVYEGLLDHTAIRADGPVLSLSGAKRKEPEIAVEELERLSGDGKSEPPAKLIEFLKEETGRSESALQKALARNLEPEEVSRFRAACGNDDGLFQRVRPFAGLVRHDTFGRPVVIRHGSMYVTAGTDRRSSGTHYTPRSLTEPIVQYTLEPLVYVGPAEGEPKEEWKLRSAAELLDLKVCDMACGSGAFLVQACRYLSERLLEAWEEAEREASGEEASRGCHSERSEESQPHAPEILRSAQNDSAQPLTTHHSPLTITPFGEPATGAAGETLIPKDPDERMVFARRLVAQRCLYGVDINPLAVEMAKLSLWLLTLAKDKPFEFLDHAIRCGDSLVGIKDLKQLECFNLDGKGESNRLILQFLPEHIRKAVELRRKIIERPAEKPEDAELQEQLLKQAGEEIERLKCAADLLIAAEFWSETAKEKQSALTASSLKVAAHFHDSSVKQFRHEADLALQRSATPSSSKPTTPFHWPLEFPEIIAERGGFDAFVGNPPFLGGVRVSEVLGVPYNKALVHSTEGSNRKADLCCYFFRRAALLLSQCGTLGLIATNSLVQGLNQRVSLQFLCDYDFSIYRADNSFAWPGDIAVVVAIIHLRHGTWRGTLTLDESPVRCITPFLTEVVAENIQPLSQNNGLVFAGPFPYGDGFLLTPKQASEFMEADLRNADVIRPFLIGQDINTHPLHEASRHIVAFEERTEGEAQTYALPYAHLLKHVRPFRMTKDPSKRDLRIVTQWWKFFHPRLELIKAMKVRDTVCVRSMHSTHHAVAIVQSNVIPGHGVIVFLGDTQTMFPIVQSVVHESWVWMTASSIGDVNNTRYIIRDCFMSFPLPDISGCEMRDMAEAGRAYITCRTAVMVSENVGLTKTYNRFHDPKETWEDIARLRELHVEMDHAVAEAYGWTDLDLGHGFHETKQGLRYTISEPARREVLDRLLLLNHERYAEEVAQGLHEKAKGKKKSGGRKQKAEKEADNDEQTVMEMG